MQPVLQLLHHPLHQRRIRSREPEDVAAEVEGLARAGYREIVLTGIHLSSYGLDFAEERRVGLLGSSNGCTKSTGSGGSVWDP